jgi:hypothetical protein
MPQGRAKKIQFQLLLADLSLQFVDASLGLGRIGDVDRDSLGRCRVKP